MLSSAASFSNAHKMRVPLCVCVFCFVFCYETFQVVATGVMKRNGSSAVLCRPLELHVLFLGGIPGNCNVPKEA